MAIIAVVAVFLSGCQDTDSPLRQEYSSVLEDESRESTESVNKGAEDSKGSSNAAAGDVRIEGFDIFLLIGQSNSHYGKGLDPEIDRAPPGVYQLGRGGDRDLAIIPAAEPLDHFSKQEDRIGFFFPFVREFIEINKNVRRKILVVPGARGATSLMSQSWSPGGDLYEDAVYRVNSVISQYPGSRLVGVLWHQGESDYFNLNYEKDLDRLIVHIRSDINGDNSKTPFVLGGLVSRWLNHGSEDVVKRKREIQRIISGTVDRVPFTGFADSENPEILKYNYSDEVIHFDAHGQRELGLRYFNAYLYALTNDNSPRVPEPIVEIKQIAKDSEVTLYWYAPNDNHSAIKGYRVMFRQKRSDAWRSVMYKGQSKGLIRFNVSDLKNGTIYEFRVAAINEKGEGRASPAVEAKPTKNYSACVLHLSLVTPELRSECGGDVISRATLFKVWSGTDGFKWYVLENRAKISGIRTKVKLKGDYTKALWFRLSAPLDERHDMHLISSAPSTGYHVMAVTPDRALYVSHGNTSIRVDTPPGVIKPEVWHHAAVSYSEKSGEVRLYLDGNEIAVGSLVDTPGGDIRIGNSSNWGFIGQMYDVRVYDGATLKRNEIRDIMRESGAIGQFE